MAQSGTHSPVLQLSRPTRFPARRAFLERHERAAIHHNESNGMAEDQNDGDRVPVADARRVVPRNGGYRPAVTIDRIIDSVAKEFKVTTEELKSRSTSAGLSFARDELCRRLRETGYTYAEIGKQLGRTHSTIIAAVKRAKYRLG